MLFLHPVSNPKPRTERVPENHSLRRSERHPATLGFAVGRAGEARSLAWTGKLDFIAVEKNRAVDDRIDC